MSKKWFATKIARSKIFKVYSSNAIVFTIASQNFIEKILSVKWFSNFGHVTFYSKQNSFFGSHFETVQKLFIFLCCNLVVIIVCIYGVNIIVKFMWKVVFLRRGSISLIVDPLNIGKWCLVGLGEVNKRQLIGEFFPFLVPQCIIFQ